MPIMVTVLMIIIQQEPIASMGYAKTLRLDLKKIAEVAKNEELFFSINSVCEDDEGNFYVLDSKKYQVQKFSAEGKKLLTFGTRGEGPDGFRTPARMFFSGETGLVVTEMMNDATIFSKLGKVVKKINFAKTLGFIFNIGYIGGNLFYAEKQGEKEVRTQIIMNNEGKILKSDLFSCSGWDIAMEDGTQYSLSYKELTPQLIFNAYKSHAVVGKSDCYQLKIIDSKGQIINKIGRDVKRSPLTSKEHDYFREEINNVKGWNNLVKKAFKKLIPSEKMYYEKLMITSKYVFVFRIKRDTTDEKSPYLVDVFAINGKFLGEVSMSKLPLLVSDTFIYFKVDDDDDALIYLEKCSYKLTL